MRNNQDLISLRGLSLMMWLADYECFDNCSHRNASRTRGIGIVRLSGPQSLDIALSVFRIKRNAPFSDVDGKGSFGSFVPQSRYLYYGSGG